MRTGHVVSTGHLPVPADFAPPPSARRRRAWDEADRAARPARLARVRARLAAAGIDAYFGVGREEIRYLTGVALGDGEEKVAGHSGRFLVSADAVVVLADSRYTIQARREAPDARIEAVTYDLPARWTELCASIGAHRIAVPAADVSHALWGALAAAAPGVELLPAGPWVAEDRAVKEPAEVERIAAACAVADRALATLLPEIRAGVTEAALAWRLEALMREGGAEALAFDVAALAGPQAALPHGSPGERRVRAGQVLLFDFGAQVAGYRSDMTRTLFVGEPRPRDLAIHELVTRAQAATISYLEASLAAGGRPERPGRRRGSPRRHRGGRPRGALRARHGPRDRPRHARGTVALARRVGGAAAEPQRLLRGARRLSRRPDRRPGRGSRPPRRIRRPGRAAHALPPRGADRRVSVAECRARRIDASDPPAGGAGRAVCYDPSHHHDQLRRRAHVPAGPEGAFHDLHRRAAQGRRHRARRRPLADPRLPPHQDGPGLGPGPDQAQERQEGLDRREVLPGRRAVAAGAAGPAPDPVPVPRRRRLPLHGDGDVRAVPPQRGPARATPSTT